jgi:16S rRNA (uracil1498-N3)-methyltransferase
VKTPPRLLVDPHGLREGCRVELDPAEARHALGPLRLRQGDRVVLIDGAGGIADGRLLRARRGRAEIEIVGIDRVAVPDPGPVLAVGVLAGAAMDLVIQKAVELGVERVVPVCCARSQHGPERANTRAGHWRRVGLQALKQCHRPWAMAVDPAVTLAELVDGPWSAIGIVADPEGGPARTIASGRRCLLVGPEGGFVADERRRLADAGWPGLRLGPHVLRAETAAIAGAAVLVSCAGDAVDSADE